MVNSSAGGNSTEDCSNLCRDDSSCNFWDWQHEVSICRLRSDEGPDGLVSDIGYTAGTKFSYCSNIVFFSQINVNDYSKYCFNKNPNRDFVLF